MNAPLFINELMEETFASCNFSKCRQLISTLFISFLGVWNDNTISSCIEIDAIYCNKHLYNITIHQFRSFGPNAGGPIIEHAY